MRNDIPMEEVIEAAKKANIHSFIASLPQVNQIYVIINTYYDEYVSITRVMTLGLETKELSCLGVKNRGLPLLEH